ncbi:DUF6760 family protein [Amycolatopsis iheyensis]|uniref:DUF6760 family protein n=1 Tax=Amycolatopsis iheyensis TaxID=2945988 RepID=UPI0027E28497|nr:DUF6760 family protein [Amycolatopsis iheyensis]
MTYTADRLWKEVVYVAYYLHWPPGEILDLDHRARARVIGEIGGIHSEIGVPRR